MTCDDCKFYGKECESHSQVRMLGMEHNMEICEIFCPKFVDCMECTRFKACQALGELTGRLTSCPDFRQKPKTNADRIRAMTDEELAKFIANKIVNLENHKMIEQGYTPTATQLSALGHTCYCTLVQWLKQPAEGDA